MNADIKNLFSFIKKSPSPFHAVSEITKILHEKGFQKLNEDENWHLETVKKYYVTRNSSSVLAFALPNVEKLKSAPFLVCASHSDSPSFKIKENPEIKSASSIVLNVEKYGGMLLAPWFDRPLSVAGRVIVSEKTGEDRISFKEILVDVDRDLLMIPNLAIHMNRDANEGRRIDVQNEIRPVLSMNERASLLSIVADSAGIPEQEIISHDLFLYNRTEPVQWGAENEFISASKLDDLECAFSTLQGFLHSTTGECEKSSKRHIPVYCVFDNEEVGSASRQGADSTFLSDTLARIAEKLNWSGEDYRIALAKSFMISADNAHAVHPNYVSSADPVNRPKINGGIVIKFNAAQKYTSDGFSAACFKEICRRAGIPFQIFTNNSNTAGGSTLGNISLSHVSIPCVDIGLPQWAMHSPYESAGSKDLEYMIQAISEFYMGKIV